MLDKILNYIIIIISIMIVIPTEKYTYGSSTEEYISKVILRIPWGNKKGEFGYHEYTEEEKKHPEPYQSVAGFAIDKDENIYIGDIQNNEILVYNKDGIFKYKIDLTKYINNLDSLAIDHKDNLYVVNWKPIRESPRYCVILDIKGNFKRKLSEPIWDVESTSDGSIFFEVREGYKSIKKRYNLNTGNLEKINRHEAIHYNKSCNYYRVIYIGAHEEIKATKFAIKSLGEYNPTGELIREINPEILLSGIIGVDKFDNIYGYLAKREEEKKGRKMQPSIIKLDKHGKLVAIIPLIKPWWKHLIDRGKDIYQISGWRGEGENQFTIIKYGRKVK